MGRSASRNKGVDQSDADWIFFLDADDLMHPDCFRNVSGWIQESGESAVSAIFGQIVEYANDCIVERYQVPRINSYQELIAFDPYKTIQMGHFVRRNCFIPFDEDMNTGEDWKYYLQLWKDFQCVKIDKPLMINVRGNHSTGPRSATGRDWGIVVREMVREARNA